MLFNSYEFIFKFLIPIFIIFQYINNKDIKLYFLIITSIVFYYLNGLEPFLILISSILINYWFAKNIQNRLKSKKKFLITIIIVNLLPLIYYKYAYSLSLIEESIIIPLAISFYTFQQIAFQFDIYQKKIDNITFKNYIFFVTFFPQLIAGPIVHYKGLIKQINFNKINIKYVEMGLILFSIGLFKKVILANSLIPISNYSFDNIHTISSYDAWIGILAYSFEIYFDFSAYSDMAIGLALFFGIKLPINFNSPYKSINIREFWRSWHITLSTFLKEHIYIPLGGNRVSIFRQSFNLLFTMIIAGIWHGSGLSFFLWGLIHGLLLVIYNIYNKNLYTIKIPKPISILITFIIITLLWVLFKVNNIDMALEYYKLLFSFNFDNINLKLSFEQLILSKELLLILMIVIVMFLPNSLEVSNYFKSDKKIKDRYIFVIALLLFISLKSMALIPKESFIYFNF